MENDLINLVNSDTNVVFIFGHTGAGKTCFIATLYEYLRNNYQLDLNYEGNVKGIKYVQSIHKQIKNEKILPKGNEVLKWYEIDIGFKKNGKEVSFRFLDFAGEDLQRHDPNTIHPIKGPSDGNLDEHVIRYLQHPQIPIIILSFADYNFAEKRDDELISNFFRYNKAFFNFNMTKVGLVISKWDNHVHTSGLRQFIDSKLHQTFEWFKGDDIKIKNAFPFSVGEIDDNNTLVNWITDDCADIVDWLASVYQKNSNYIETEEKAPQIERKQISSFKDWLSIIKELIALLRNAVS